MHFSGRYVDTGQQSLGIQVRVVVYHGDVPHDTLIFQFFSQIFHKLNAGKYVGTFNTKKLWPLTDQSDRIFYKYMSMDVDTIQQMVESHIAACVLTDKGKTDEEEDS